MPAHVKLNLPKFPNPLISQSLMQEVGQLAVRLIRTRTEQGTDAKGRPFQPYSPEYAERKADELGSGTVNLTVSGRMLNDMQVVSTTNSKVTLGFISSGGRAPKGKQTLIQRSRSVGAADKAFWHHVAGAGKSRVKREFFELSHDDQKVIRERVERYLESAVIGPNK
jgi:phage gpG-like protein